MNIGRLEHKKATNLMLITSCDHKTMTLWNKVRSLFMECGDFIEFMQCWASNHFPLQQYCIHNMHRNCENVSANWKIFSENKLVAKAVYQSGKVNLHSTFCIQWLLMREASQRWTSMESTNSRNLMDLFLEIRINYDRTVGLFFNLIRNYHSHQLLCNIMVWIIFTEYDHN